MSLIGNLKQGWPINQTINLTTGWAINQIISCFTLDSTKLLISRTRQNPYYIVENITQCKDRSQMLWNVTKRQHCTRAILSNYLKQVLNNFLPKFAQ